MSRIDYKSDSPNRTDHLEDVGDEATDEIRFRESSREFYDGLFRTDSGTIRRSLKVLMDCPVHYAGDIIVGNSSSGVVTILDCLGCAGLACPEQDIQIDCVLLMLKIAKLFPCHYRPIHEDAAIEIIGQLINQGRNFRDFGLLCISLRLISMGLSRKQLSPEKIRDKLLPFINDCRAEKWWLQECGAPYIELLVHFACDDTIESAVNDLLSLFSPNSSRSTLHSTIVAWKLLFAKDDASLPNELICTIFDRACDIASSKLSEDDQNLSGELFEFIRYMLKSYLDMSNILLSRFGPQQFKNLICQIDEAFHTSDTSRLVPMLSFATTLFKLK